MDAPIAKSYQPITNAMFLDTIEDALQGIDGVKLVSVGSVCARGRVFVTAKLSQLESFKAAGREFKAYLNFLNSHDGSAAFVVNTSNVCTVCNNTFSMNLHSGKSDVNIRLKHTRHVANRLENVAEVVDGVLGAQAEFRAIMDTLSTKRITTPSARALFADFVGPGAGSKRNEGRGMSTQKLETADRLTQLFLTGRGNRGNDLSDVFSATTDYFSHESMGEDKAEQMISSEFARGAREKNRMLHLLTEPAEVIVQRIKSGNQLLAETLN